MVIYSRNFISSTNCNSNQYFIKYNFQVKNLKVSLLFGIIFVLSFLMIMNSNVSNIDNNQFYPDGAVRYALTNSELVSFDTISNFNMPILRQMIII